MHSSCNSAILIINEHDTGELDADVEVINIEAWLLRYNPLTLFRAAQFWRYKVDIVYRMSKNPVGNYDVNWCFLNP